MLKLIRNSIKHISTHNYSFFAFETSFQRRTFMFCAL